MAILNNFGTQVAHHTTQYKHNTNIIQIFYSLMLLLLLSYELVACAHNLVRGHRTGHRTGSSYSGVEEYLRKNVRRNKYSNTMFHFGMLVDLEFRVPQDEKGEHRRPYVYERM